MTPRQIVDATINTLLGRKGFDDWWDELDDETQDEIIEEVLELIDYSSK